MFNRLRQGQRLTNLACLSLVSLFSKSFMFSSSNPLFPHLVDLCTLLTIFNKPHVINILWTVWFPFIVIHVTLATYTKLEWLNVYRVTVTQCWAHSGSTQIYHFVQTNLWLDNFLPDHPMEVIQRLNKSWCYSYSRSHDYNKA